jgi:hypothetical protein
MTEKDVPQRITFGFTKDLSAQRGSPYGAAS